MAQIGSPNFGEVARVAFDLWRAIDGPLGNDKSPEAKQRALKLYEECVKAVEGDAFDVTKIK